MRYLKYFLPLCFLFCCCKKSNFGKYHARLRTVTFLDLGDIMPHTQHTIQISIKNVGSAPLEISNITSSCTCTVTDGTTRKTLEPDKQFVVNVTISEPEGLGPVTSQLSISSNDPLNPVTVVHIQSNRQPIVRLVPSRLTLWNEPLVLFPKKLRIRVQCTKEDQVLDSVSVENNFAWLSCIVQPAQNNVCEVECTLGSDCPAGQIEVPTNITAKMADSGRVYKLVAYIAGSVIGEIRAVPDVLTRERDRDGKYIVDIDGPLSKMICQAKVYPTNLQKDFRFKQVSDNKWEVWISKNREHTHGEIHFSDSSAKELLSVPVYVHADSSTSEVKAITAP